MAQVRIKVDYARGKPFEREYVTKVVYKGDDDQEVVVEGNDLLTYQFPLSKELMVYAADGASNVSCQGLRAISAYDMENWNL